MLDEADDKVDTGDDTMGSAVALGPSLSGSSSSSSDSDANAASSGASLDRITLRDQRPGSRMTTSAGRGDADFRPPATPKPAVPERKEEEKNDGQVCRAVDVLVLQSSDKCNETVKTVLLSIAILCILALLLFLRPSLWISVHRYLRANAPSSPAGHASLSFFSGCDGNACKKYMGALESTLNRSQDPCQDFYRFVCDGWTGQHRSISVLEAAEELMYSRALNAIRWPLLNSSSKEFPSSVEQKVAGFAGSCMHFSESSLEYLKKFMAERHLPWPKASRWDLLEILLDLSGNWNLHLWFQVSFEMTPFRGGASEPVLRISHSPSFGTWITFMRSFAGQPVASTSAHRYRRYVKDMLKFFDVSGSSADELAIKIEEMDRLTLEVLGPAMAEHDPKTLRVPISNLTVPATPSISTGHLLLLLNEYFIWARRFSAGDVVEVVNPVLLRSVVYLRNLKSETKQALTLSLGLRVAHELGWMAHRGIAEVTLDIMGLPRSAHHRRCLTLIESAVGVGWLSLFQEQPGTDALVQDVRDILSDTLKRRGKQPLTLQSRPTPAQSNNESSIVNVLPDTTPGARFFVDWMNLMNSRGRLQEHHLLYVLKPGSMLSHRWNFHGNLTVAEDYFVFPLYHPDLPTAVNYGGAGRLIADELLRGLFYNPQREYTGLYENSHHAKGSSTSVLQQDSQPYSVDKKALLAALAAYRLGTVRDPVGSRASSQAQDRLFFVASCYALCSNKHIVDTMYRDARSRCNEPLKGLPEFSVAFNCGIWRTYS